MIQSDGVMHGPALGIRRRCKELEPVSRPTTSPSTGKTYLRRYYRYQLEPCGHVVERGQPNRTFCYCEVCPPDAR